MAGLTPKREAFCQQYVVDHNATQAAIRAGYSDATAQQQGSRLLLDVVVQARIAALQAEVAERNEVTVDSIVAELEEARNQAITTGQSSAAVQASMGKAKVCGLLVDRYRDENQHQSEADLIRMAAKEGPLAGAAILNMVDSGRGMTGELLDEAFGDEPEKRAAVLAALDEIRKSGAQLH